MPVLPIRIRGDVCVGGERLAVVTNDAHRVPDGISVCRISDLFYKVGDYENATELLRDSGISTILVGVFLTELPLLLVLFGVACCWWLISVARTESLYPVSAQAVESGERPRPRPNPRRTLVLLVMGIVLLLEFYLSAWPFFVLSALLLVITLVVTRGRPEAPTTGAGSPGGCSRRSPCSSSI